MIQSTTNGKVLESVDVEHDIARTLAKSPPPRDHRRIDFAPAIRTQTPPMPAYVEHHADVDQIGKLSAEAVIAQYEDAVKALEAMGTTLIDCVKRAEKMAAGCKDAIAYVQDTAQKYREEAKVIFDRIEQASVMTAEVRSVCDEMRKKIEHPMPSA
jgi:ABC-type hemin transport system substrate-binding protein